MYVEENKLISWNKKIKLHTFITTGSEKVVWIIIFIGWDCYTPNSNLDSAHVIRLLCSLHRFIANILKIGCHVLIYPLFPHDK